MQMWQTDSQYNAIQYNTIQYNTIQYKTKQNNTIQYNTIQYNTIQYNTIRIKKKQLMDNLFFNIKMYEMENKNRVSGLGKYL